VPANEPRARSARGGSFGLADFVQQQGLDARQRTLAVALEAVLDHVVQAAMRLLEQREGLQEGLLNSLVRSARADFCVQHHHHHRFLFAALVGLCVKLHELG
jgi:ATP phosphoribosyltransferase regulatory subunit HisZ